MLRRVWRRLLERSATSRGIAALLVGAGVYLIGLPLIFTVFAHKRAVAQELTRIRPQFGFNETELRRLRQPRRRRVAP